MDWLVFWRDASLIWLSLLCFVGLVPPLVIGYFLVRGMGWVLRKSGWLFGKAQGYSHQGRTIVDDASQRAVAPVIAMHKQGAKAEAVLRRIWPSRRAASPSVIRTSDQTKRQYPMVGEAVATPVSLNTESKKGAKIYG